MKESDGKENIPHGGKEVESQRKLERGEKVRQTVQLGWHGSMEGMQRGKVAASPGMRSSVLRDHWGAIKRFHLLVCGFAKAITWSESPVRSSSCQSRKTAARKLQ